MALLTDRFVGARAVWDPHTLRELVACVAEPASVGLASIAGLTRPSPREVPGGVHVRTGEGRVVAEGGGWTYEYHLRDHLGSTRVAAP